MYCPFKLAGAKASGSRDTMCERGDCALWKAVDCRTEKVEGNHIITRPIYGCALRGPDVYIPDAFKGGEDDGESGYRD